MITYVTICTVAFNNLDFTDAFYWNEKIFSEQYQRPCQYLARLIDPTAKLDNYLYKKSDVTKDANRFLYVVLKYEYMCVCTCM